MNHQRTAITRINQLSTKTDQVTRYVIAFLLAAMSVLVFMQVLFRYAINAPLDWSEELASFAFVWMGLLGASVGLRSEDHPRLDILVSCLPEPMKKIAKVLVNSSIIFTLVILLFFGYRLTLSMKIQSTAALGYSVSFAYAVLPISALIMLIHVIAQTMQLLSNKTQNEED
jgi:TRAP-type C4-dicarboxylate transport system permease small subunit